MGLKRKNLDQSLIVKVICFFRDLAGARTRDPFIKSEMLYQLSYQVILKTPSCFAKRVQI